MVQEIFHNIHPWVLEFVLGEVIIVLFGSISKGKGYSRPFGVPFDGLRGPKNAIGYGTNKYDRAADRKAKRSVPKIAG
jgi:hypothetical protein